MTETGRDPARAGPVAELFDRLHRLHLAAGRPSTRTIASRSGHEVSSSTVHNVFNSSRLPRWDSLREIVRALNGDTAEFLSLWQAAWQAQNTANTPQYGSVGTGPPARELVVPAAPSGFQRIWSAELPSRKPHYTGREGELDTLRANLVLRDAPHPRPQVISGVGGIGKTEIATEYLHRYRDEYEIIWWIRTEHRDRVREALVKLGQRLELPLAAAGSGRDRAITAVLEALESGVRPNWLLVYDNAAQPLDLQSYLPKCPLVATSSLLHGCRPGLGT